ncbi:uncharacterized protein Dvar_19890 [Desulfosarcina variabilis str. Montpellier]
MFANFNRIRQGASAGAYFKICVGGLSAVDGSKDRQDGRRFFYRGPQIREPQKLSFKIKGAVMSGIFKYFGEGMVPAKKVAKKKPVARKN